MVSTKKRSNSQVSQKINNQTNSDGIITNAQQISDQKPKRARSNTDTSMHSGDSLFSDTRQMMRVTRGACAQEADDWATAIQQSVQEDIVPTPAHSNPDTSAQSAPQSGEMNADPEMSEKGKKVKIKSVDLEEDEEKTIKNERSRRCKPRQSRIRTSIPEASLPSDEPNSSLNTISSPLADNASASTTLPPRKARRQTRKSQNVKDVADDKADAEIISKLVPSRRLTRTNKTKKATDTDAERDVKNSTADNEDAATASKNNSRRHIHEVLDEDDKTHMTGASESQDATLSGVVQPREAASTRRSQTRNALSANTDASVGATHSDYSSSFAEQSQSRRKATTTRRQTRKAPDDVDDKDVDIKGSSICIDSENNIMVESGDANQADTKSDSGSKNMVLPAVITQVEIQTKDVTVEPTTPLTDSSASGSSQVVQVQGVPQASSSSYHSSPSLPMRAKHVILGRYELAALYGAPLPRRLCGAHRVHFCEFCLKLVGDQTALERHAPKCPHRRPPGREIYRDGDLSVFEVDGRVHRTYCQNLCLLSKLFMNSKSLSYDVPVFAFFVVTKRLSKSGAPIAASRGNGRGGSRKRGGPSARTNDKRNQTDENTKHELVAYFSKEKQSAIGNTLSCILTLPQFQRQGYGRFLISLAYELSKRQRIPGTPERPLSDSGERGFRSFWIWTVARLLLEQEHGVRKMALEAFSVADMSEVTGIHANDLLSVLKDLRVCKYSRGVYSVTPTEAVRATLQQALESVPVPRLLCKPDKLEWTVSS